MSTFISHLALFCPGDAEDLQQLQVSDDLREPEQPSLPAGRQRRAAGAAGGPRLGQSELDAGLRRPGELGEEAALRAHAVSGQTLSADSPVSREHISVIVFQKTCSSRSGVSRDAALSAAVARSGRKHARRCERRRPVDAALRPAGAPRHADGEQTADRFVTDTTIYNFSFLVAFLKQLPRVSKR